MLLYTFAARRNRRLDAMQHRRAGRVACEVLGGLLKRTELGRGLQKPLGGGELLAALAVTGTKECPSEPGSGEASVEVRFA